MTINFTKLTLDDVCIKITDGAPSSPPSVSMGMPMASVKDLTRFGIELDACRHISEEDYQKLIQQNCKPEIGDVLISKDGASALDTVCEVKKPLDVVLLSSVAILRPNAQKISSSFLRYYLDAESTRQYMKNAFTTGAAIPRVVLKDFKKVRILVPPMPVQHKIASILSAYDDLIENNNRRIKILEEMAQAIYKEWFVNFRFPGHEKVKMVSPSPLGRGGGEGVNNIGMISEGWEVVKSSDAVEITPSIRVDKNKSKPYVDMGGLSETSMIIESKGQRTGGNGSKYVNGDTLFARITPCLENGKTGFVQFLDEGEEGIGSTEFIVLRSKSLCPEFVYLLARSEDFRNNAIKSMTGASGRQRVQPECFDKFQLAQPIQNILDKFAEIVRPMFQSIHQVDFKNKNLCKTRDLLLPKLISGEIDVEGMEIRMTA